MASIPLPALAIQQPPSATDQLSKLLEMKSLLGQQQVQQQQITAGEQENQMRAMQLHDMQTIQSIAPNHIQKDANGKITGYDFDGLQNDAIANGVRPQSLSPLIAMRKQAADAVLAQQQGQEAFLKNQNTMMDQLTGHLEAFRNATPDQKQTELDNAFASSQKYGIPWTLPRDATQVTNQMLDGAEMNLAMHSQFLKDAQTKAQTRESNAKAAMDELGAQTKQKFLSMTMDDVDRFAQSVADPTQYPALYARGRSMMEHALAMKDQEAFNAAGKMMAEQSGAIEKETNPAVQGGKVAVATAEGQARANIEAAQARGSSAALATVPPHLVAPASAAAAKAGQDYAQAQSVSQRLQAMMDAAKNGNVVSYQLIPQEGALQVTTSQGVHRINMAEIQNYGGGSLWQRLQGHIGKELTGESIPKSVLNDMADMQKIQAEGSQTKYENDLKTINQTYGSAFQPVEMAPLARNQKSQPQHVPGGKATGLSDGQTGTGSDGKKYIVKGGVWQPAQ